MIYSIPYCWASRMFQAYIINNVILDNFTTKSLCLPLGTNCENGSAGTKYIHNLKSFRRGGQIVLRKCTKFTLTYILGESLPPCTSASTEHYNFENSARLVQLNLLFQHFCIHGDDPASSLPAPPPPHTSETGPVSSVSYNIYGGSGTEHDQRIYLESFSNI